MISGNLLPFTLNTINNASGQHSPIKNKLFKLFTFSLWFSVQSLFVINESRVNFWRFFAKTTTHIVVQDTKPFRAKSENWRITMGRIGINSLLSVKFKILDCKKHGIYRLFVMYFGSCSLASYCLDRLENPLLTNFKAERDADFARAFLIAIACKGNVKIVFHLCLMLLPTCSLALALSSASPRAPATLRYLTRLKAAISSASAICFL